ncbi:MAG: hypothetical protein PHV82_10050 [Victivallaceae bacterium]|nr:hypothetical protein [Victivallaceae bacterium]
MILNTFSRAFSEAWNMLIEFPLPFLGRADDKKYVETESTVILTQLLFPVVGIVCAVLAWLLGKILGTFFYPVPAAAVFAGVLTCFCVYKDNGRGLAGLMALACYKRKDISFENTLLNLPDGIGDISMPAATLTMILVIMFKLLAFSLMVLYGYTFWLISVLVLEFTIEGDLATLSSLEQGRPQLAVKKTKQRYIWFFAAFLILFVLLKAPAANLVLFGVAFAFDHALKTYCQNRFDGIDSRIISLAAYVFELFALLLGLLFLTKGAVVLL